MAFFLVQPKGDWGRWCEPHSYKLNLTISADKTRLEALRKENENVFKISFNEMKEKTHRIVEGKLISMYTKSRLKVEILKLAVSKRWSHEETMRALYELSPSERKKLLETASEET